MYLNNKTGMVSYRHLSSYGVLIVCVFLFVYTPASQADGVRNERIYKYLGNHQETQENVTKRIEKTSKLIKKNPDNADLYLKRGFDYFLLRSHDKAINDFTQALKLDNKLDHAYFGRGMALARNGQVNKGIADLTVYIKRHPKSSLAHTKRGVRYIWKGKLDNAERDLKKAIALDPSNAEAHDDIGVIYAQHKNFVLASSHFRSAIRSEPSYQKAHHNLAMVYFIQNQTQRALITVNNALKLNPESRNSLLLKATILQALGRFEEAKKAKDDADFLPEGNWTERYPIN